MSLNLNSTARTFFFLIVLIAALLALVGIAASAEEQALQAVPSYANPITLEIEDTGNNPGLGQGMTENLVMSTPANLLVDDEGNTFITFRIGLVVETQEDSFIIELLDDAGAVKESLPYSIVSDNQADNTRDLQVQVPSVDAILRVSLVSIPMGREVVGFISFAPEGDAVEIPVAQEQEVDDTPISIYENTANEEVTGVAEEDRGPLLTFLAIAGSLIVLVGGVAAINALRKKNA
ncbi:MAG: hypothetical protein FWD41_02560 [Actinomycetia bacterium]|nr:hypothetical protein [Actinomycetes bacterium]